VYVALLRAINVGGKNLVSMASLKASFERRGFQDVTTYINSGNVLFRSAETDARKLEESIDRMLSREFAVNSKTLVRSYREMARVVKTMSQMWRRDPRWRRNVIFLRDSIDPERVLAGITLKPDIERVVCCPGTLLWSARVSDLTRAAMLKLSSQPVYRDLTVRNMNTTARIFELMTRMSTKSVS